MNNNITNVSAEEARDRSGRIYHVSGNLLICKETSRLIPNHFVNTIRSSINQFSAGSATRMRRYLRGCVSDYQNMVTLTYPGFFTSNGAESKNHLRRFLQECKRYIELHDSASVQRHSIFWFLEFQNRGAPHYHLFTTEHFPKDWVSRTWYRIVNSEDLRHLAAGTRCEKLKSGRGGTISYAQKYANKQCQKEVPDGYTDVGRFWGVSGRRSVVSADTFVSLRQADDPLVRGAEKAIGKEVEVAVWRAQVEVFKRAPGVGVYIIYDKQVMLELRRLIMRLAYVTANYPAMFLDAELDGVVM